VSPPGVRLASVPAVGVWRQVGPGLSSVGEALRRVVGTGRVAALGVACIWYPGAAERFRPVLEPPLDAGG
jgi:arginase